MLNENTLFGPRDKVAIAIQRIKEFEPMAIQNNPAGYHVCISGGKDSSVIQELCIMAGVKCEFVHSHTSVDHPETVCFVRAEKKRLEELGYVFRIEIPRYEDGKQKTMWNGIVRHGLPLRTARWCCSELKETAGKGRYIITGVRWAESSRRKINRALYEIHRSSKKYGIITNNDNDMRRRLSEFCLKKNQFILNPIVDWSDDDVWEFLTTRKPPINPLYAQGYKRVGCIGCPMNVRSRMELDKFPKYKAAYLRAVKKYIECRPPRPDDNQAAEEYFEWWLTGKRGRKYERLGIM